MLSESYSTTINTPKKSRVPLGFGSSAPRSAITTTKARGVTKPVSPKFSTTLRVQSRRPPSRSEPKKTQLQLEADLIKAWFTQVFEEKLQENPYIASQYDTNVPELSLTEFKRQVLERNLTSSTEQHYIREQVLDENREISAPILRQLFRAHKALLELKSNNTIVVLKISPGASVTNINSKNNAVLFKQLW